MSDKLLLQPLWDSLAIRTISMRPQPGPTGGLGRTTGPVRPSVRVLLGAILLGALLASALPRIASADTTYTYTGGAYTSCSGTYTAPCSQYSITGSFTTSLSLSQLENLTNFSISTADITALSFSDGSGLTINLSNATLTGALSSVFDITTDASGNIINWIVAANQEPTTLLLGSVANNITTFSLPTAGSSQDSSVTGTITNIVSCLPVGCVTASGGGSNSGAPGVWSAPVETPEPSTLLLFGAGLLGFFFRRLRRS